MDKSRILKQGEIYRNFEDRLYQIIAIAAHNQTGEPMVVYQELGGEGRIYTGTLDLFLSRVDQEKYPYTRQIFCFERMAVRGGGLVPDEAAEAEAGKGLSISREEFKPPEGKESAVIEHTTAKPVEVRKEEAELPEAEGHTGEDEVNSVLLQFLDAASYNKKLEIVTSNTKYLDDRLINDMAVALDCTVEEGSLEQRILGLVQCLQAMRRFEDRRLR